MANTTTDTVPQEKIEYAALLLSQGKSRDEVRSIIAEKWKNEEMADRVMLRLNGKINPIGQEDAINDIRIGGLLLILCIAIPIIVYMVSGGGFIMFSFLLLIYALYRLIRGISRYQRSN